MFRDLLKIAALGAGAVAVKVCEGAGVLEKQTPRCARPGESHDYQWGTCKHCGGMDPVEAAERASTDTDQGSGGEDKRTAPRGV